MNNVIVLIATTPRLSLLFTNALPSIINQTTLPKAVVIVSDKRDFTLEEKNSLHTSLKDIPLYALTNTHSTGAAGSWNTGIDFISRKFPNSYIAIIDDDDKWDKNHITACLSSSDSGTADVVLSGIKVIINNEIVAENIPNNLSIQDFLTGNPGWQGSNTFIKTSLVQKIGGFTDGLISSNDRDFAIKVLDSKSSTISYTKTATVNWYCNQSSDALSAPGSKQKLQGSAQFLRLHGTKMSEKDMDSYFSRLYKLFSLSKQQVLDEMKRLGDIK